jgi:hypothetical protein
VITVLGLLVVPVMIRGGDLAGHDPLKRAHMVVGAAVGNRCVGSWTRPMSRSG